MPETTISLTATSAGDTTRILEGPELLRDFVVAGGADGGGSATSAENKHQLEGQEVGQQHGMVLLQAVERPTPLPNGFSRIPAPGELAPRPERGVLKYALPQMEGSLTPGRKGIFFSEEQNSWCGCVIADEAGESITVIVNASGSEKRTFTKDDVAPYGFRALFFPEGFCYLSREN
jgi:hypothetical protein